MKIVALTAADEAAIRDWPLYPGKLAVFNYALGKCGWLADFPERIGNRRFAAWHEQQLVGFAILTATGQADAEFYIAIRSDLMKHGYGRILTTWVLRTGFTELGLKRIHLKVRKWHTQAIELYSSLGFSAIGEKDIEIDGRVDRFVEMEAFPA